MRFTAAQAIALGVIALALALIAPSPAAAGPFYPYVGPFSANEGGGDGMLRYPKRVAIDRSSGLLYVANSQNNRIEVFATSSGASTPFLTKFGAETLSAPSGVAVDQVSGAVYVADAGNDRIVRFVSDDAPVPTFTIDATFTSPPAVATPGSPLPGEIGSFDSSLAVDPTSGDLVVADTGLDLIQRYDSDGTFVAAHDGTANGGTAFTGLLDLAIDSTGDIIVIDSATGSLADVSSGSPVEVVRYTAAGDYEATLPSVPSPGVVAIDPSDDAVLLGANFESYFNNQKLRIVKIGNDNVEKFSIPLEQTKTWGIFGGLAALDNGRVYVVTDLDAIERGWGGPAGGFIYGPLTYLPTVAPGAAPSPTRTTATLAGSVDPDGGEPISSCKFVVNDGSGPQSVPCDPAPPIASQTEVTADLSGLKAQTEHTYYLEVNNPNGIVIKTPTAYFTTLPAIADLTTEDASDIGPGTATLNASLDPEGMATSYSFEYGLTTEYTDTTPVAETSEAGSTGLASVIGGLAPYKTYHYRVVATNAIGTTYGADRTFRSSIPELPELGVTSASGVTASGATLHSAISPGFGPTVYRFQYGPTPDLGQNTPTSDPIGDDDAVHAVSETIGGLQPGTTYYYRVIATNLSGAVRSPLATFSTPGFPSVLSSGVGSVAQTAARLEGLIRPGLAATTYRFEYGRDASYGASTPAAGPTPADNVDRAVSAEIGGLEPGATYHFRLVVTNDVGVAVGPDQTFTTAAAPPVTKPKQKTCPKGKVRRRGKCVKKPGRCRKGKVKKRGKCVRKKAAKRHGKRRKGHA